MATIHSTDTPTTAQYRLPEEHRQAIIARSNLSLQRAVIERQRLAFLATFPDEDEYGQEKTQNK